jgi:hypothetical protein
MAQVLPAEVVPNDVGGWNWHVRDLANASLPAHEVLVATQHSGLIVG